MIQGAEKVIIVFRHGARLDMLSGEEYKDEIAELSPPGDLKTEFDTPLSKVGHV